MPFRFRFAPSKRPHSRPFLKQRDQYGNQVAYDQHIPRSAVRFTRRGVRETLECGDFALREHLAKLTQLDYVLVHRGLNGRPLIRELDLDFRELEAGVARAGHHHRPGRNPAFTLAPSLKLPSHFKLTTLSYLEVTLSRP